MRNTSTIEWELSRTKKFDKLYVKLGGENLKRFQGYLLEIMKDFDNFAKRHDLDYFMVAGTLIGAKRHGGFIPWDDDIDIVLLREDFEKINKLLKKDELSEKYSFVDPRETGEISTCAKFKSKDVTYNSLLGDGFSKNKKIYIDILPLDYVPENKLQKKLLGIIINILHISFSSNRVFKKNNELLHIMSKESKELKINLFFRKILAIPALLLGTKRTMILIHKLLMKTKEKTSQVTIALGVKKYFGEILNYEDLFPTHRIKFEDCFFKAPQKEEAYLENRYGNYLEIPPKKEQNERLVRLRDDWKEYL